MEETHNGESVPVDKLRIGSLCTGIGGLDLAVEAHFGADLAWYSEVEDGPCEILRRVYPDVKNHGDLTLIDWGSVEPVDIITAGYPCQPFSSAGKRKGASDVRHLWPYIAEGVRHLRPRYVVLENVRGHLTLGFDAVLGSLAEAGFDAEWCVLRASDVGACHQRARVFVVATDARRAEWRPEGGPRRATREYLVSTERHEGAAAPVGDRQAAPVDWGVYGPAIERWGTVLGQPAPRPTDDEGRLDPPFVEWMMGYPLGWVDGLTRTQKLKALGNAVVPQQGLAALAELHGFGDLGIEPDGVGIVGVGVADGLGREPQQTQLFGGDGDGGHASHHDETSSAVNPCGQPLATTPTSARTGEPEGD